jgi:hypothetical protein
VTIFLDIVLAFTKSVPQLDGLVTRTRHDLTVVGREGNREDITSVTNETAGGLAVVQVPETESGIPGSRQSELTVRGDGEIFNKVVVTSQGLARNTVVDFVPGQVPDNDGLVYEEMRDK